VEDTIIRKTLTTEGTESAKEGRTCEAASHAIGWCLINMCGGGWGADSTAAAKEL
jgi:hypothetical protein